MIIINNNDGGMCNRLRLMAHVLAFAIENNQSVTHLFFSDLKSKIVMDDTVLPIEISLPEASKARTRLHNIRKKIKRHLHLIRELEASDVLKILGKKGTASIDNWGFRVPDLFIKYQKYISAYLAINDGDAEYARRIIEEIHRSCGESTTKVGVHLRRGDYSEWRGGMYYYSNASYLKWMKTLYQESDGQVCFLLFSNEPIDTMEFSQIIPTSKMRVMNGSGTQDLATMSLCDYIFGPPSTYSEWAAYVGNRMYLNVEVQDQDISFTTFESMEARYRRLYDIAL